MATLANLRPGRVAIVVGIDHKIQYLIQDIPEDHPRNLLRLRFQDFLAETMGGYPVSVICEEAKHGMVSLA